MSTPKGSSVTHEISQLMAVITALPILLGSTNTLCLTWWIPKPHSSSITEWRLEFNLTWTLWEDKQPELCFPLHMNPAKILRQCITCISSGLVKNNLAYIKKLANKRYEEVQYQAMQKEFSKTQYHSLLMAHCLGIIGQLETKLSWNELSFHWRLDRTLVCSWRTWVIDDDSKLYKCYRQVQDLLSTIYKEPKPSMEFSNTNLKTMESLIKTCRPCIILLSGAPIIMEEQQSLSLPQGLRLPTSLQQPRRSPLPIIILDESDGDTEIEEEQAINSVQEVPKVQKVTSVQGSMVQERRVTCSQQFYQRIIDKEMKKWSKPRIHTRKRLKLR